MYIKKNKQKGTIYKEIYIFYKSFLRFFNLFFYIFFQVFITKCDTRMMYYFQKKLADSCAYQIFVKVTPCVGEYLYYAPNNHLQKIRSNKLWPIKIYKQKKIKQNGGRRPFLQVPKYASGPRNCKMTNQKRKEIKQNGCQM